MWWWYNIEINTLLLYFALFAGRVLQWVALSWERSTLSANRSKLQTAPCYSPSGSLVFTVNCVMQSIVWFQYWGTRSITQLIRQHMCSTQQSTVHSSTVITWLIEVSNSQLGQEPPDTTVCISYSSTLPASMSSTMSVLSLFSVRQCIVPTGMVNGVLWWRRWEELGSGWIWG